MTTSDNRSLNQLPRENKSLRAQLETLRLNHYQAQLESATQVVGEIKHSHIGMPVRVALTAASLSLPHGTLLVAVQQREIRHD